MLNWVMSQQVLAQPGDTGEGPAMTKQRNMEGEGRGRSGQAAAAAGASQSSASEAAATAPVLLPTG